MLIYIDPGYEEWKTLYIENEITNYDVSTYGNVRKRNSHEILKIHAHHLSKKDNRYVSNPDNLYRYVNLTINGETKHYYIHRLVLSVFDYISDWKSHEVNHIDGVKFNNKLSNLEWCTRSENQLHAFKTGLKRDLFGEKKARSKYKNEEIIEMCKMMKNNVPTKYIVEKFNITDKELLSDIRMKRRWSKVTKDFSFDKIDQSGENNPSAKYTSEDVHNVCKCFENNMTNTEIFQKYNHKYSKDFISKLRRRKNWNDITNLYDY